MSFMRNLTQKEVGEIRNIITTVMNEDIYYAYEIFEALGNKIYEMKCENFIGNSKITVAEGIASDVKFIATLDCFYENEMLKRLGYGYHKIVELTVDENGIMVILKY